MSSDKCPSRTALQVVLEFKALLLGTKTNDIRKEPWRESGCGRIFASVVLFQAVFRPGGKTNIEAVRFGLGDDNIHVEHRRQPGEAE
jgi:hypothetical protein